MTTLAAQSISGAFAKLDPILQAACVLAIALLVAAAIVRRGFTDLGSAITALAAARRDDDTPR